MWQEFARYRNREEDLARVERLKSILQIKTVTAEYGLPKYIRVMVKGAIVDDAARKAIEAQGWDILFDPYREMSMVFIPHAKRIDVTYFVTLVRNICFLAVLICALRVMYYMREVQRVVV